MVEMALDHLAKDKIVELEEEDIEGAEVVVVSYGITCRVAERAVALARAKGLKVGKLRLITAWPFPEEKIVELVPKVKACFEAAATATGCRLEITPSYYPYLNMVNNPTMTTLFA